ncbi:RcnB family protein [Acinetobacter sp. ANC 4648]|uniref:RcnB family protein n=1 Tax=Acinetobacter sp. ANC 4648 TaxID=1977875 RepID=UPI000A344851|nr:RcnB family protein [Acinetobacter sp. ANC 4648]OTG84707.1 hypothetical protein B9T27_00325 [Acinetobacter sp. ANC 4648]
MKKIFILTALTLLITGGSTLAMADAKDWGNYRGVERQQPHKYPYTTTYQGYADPYGHPFTQEYPIQPPLNQRPPHWGPPPYPSPSYPSYPAYPPQNGVTIIYNDQFPTRTESRTESHGFVNGDANSKIESSRYTLISDWRRYGLPDPQVGMHWIFQNGRYVQVPNDR